MTVHVPFDNSFARLLPGHYARVRPTPVAAPRLVKLNHALALELGLDPEELSSPAGVEMLAGRNVPEGADPIALAYAGHQFGSFVPQLGDGRAILLGEVVDRSGERRDIQLKGSGRTPFSRGGDGRAALGPVLREYLVSEAMAALGIPTTRALAAVLTGEEVMRETYLPGAVLTRVASSHIRIGSFQFFAARGDEAAVRRLADHSMARHDPDASRAAEPYRAFLAGVVARQADLVARWMLVGFIHGVMNTDNMSISGETIDYGPCAFMDAYDPNTVFSSIDQFGRYAYANQPGIAQWNLARLAECLLPLLDEDETKAIAKATEVLSGFAGQFNQAYLGGLRRKIGLTGEEDGDGDLIKALVETMNSEKADFTLTFRQLGEAAGMASHNDPSPLAPAFAGWIGLWRDRLEREPMPPAGRRAMMHAVNPAFIPRNHRVEEALAAAAAEDLTPFDRLMEILARPYDDQPANAAYAAPPHGGSEGYRTFCGT